MIKSVISPNVYIKNSDIDGFGMYAKESIKSGEIVFIKGGHILHKTELFTSATINSYIPISDEYFVGAVSAEEEKDVKLYNNHSCNPNCGMHGEITFIAIRDIEIGEELTVDYAFIDNEDYSFECHCGSEDCRHIVTGFDWKIKKLQEKYYPYFSQYLKDKIDKMNQKQNSGQY